MLIILDFRREGQSERGFYQFEEGVLAASYEMTPNHYRPSISFQYRPSLDFMFIVNSVGFRFNRRKPVCLNLHSVILHELYNYLVNSVYAGLLFFNPIVQKQQPCFYSLFVNFNSIERFWHFNFNLIHTLLSETYEVDSLFFR